MSIIGRMLMRMVLIRFLFIWIGVSLFVLSLDIIGNLDDILKFGGYDILAGYALHRAPGVLATFLPISTLLAMLLGLTELGYRNETPAIWSSGVSPWRMAAMIAPVGMTLGAAHFLLSDRAMPWAAPQLRNWAIGDYSEKQIKLGEKDPVWMRAGHDILRADATNADATEMTGVIIFRRDDAGNLTEQIHAQTAILRGASWELSDAAIYGTGKAPPRRVALVTYDGSVRPAKAGYRSGDPEEMTLGDLSYFIENNGFGIRPAFVFETWWHKRISLFATAMTMVLLCVPLAARFRRGGGIGAFFAIGIALGFVFFLFDGLALTMGELGIVTPWLAAWSPVLIFSAIAAMIAFRTETV